RRQRRKFNPLQKAPVVASERPSAPFTLAHTAQQRRINAHQMPSTQRRLKPDQNFHKKVVRIQATKQTQIPTTPKLPDRLVGPAPVVSIQVEGIYTKALLDTGAQVTLLYRDFYDKHLKHLPLQKLEELEIWGIGTQNFPYDGYLPVRLTFDPSVAGKTETFDTLAVVCPRPVGVSTGSLIIGTNTDLVRRLLTPVVLESDTSTTSVHPLLRQAYQRLVQEQKAPAEGVGKIWRLDRREKVLQPGEVACLQASVKLNWKQPGPFIVVEADGQRKGSGVEIIPEVVSTKALQRSHGKIPVSVCNITALPVKMPARMLLGQVNPATPVSLSDLVGEEKDGIPAKEFYLENTPLPPEWKERAKAQLQGWKVAFSKSEFDVGCAKSAKHRIRLKEDKPFRERVRRIPLGDLEDLREQLAE
ncbi:unnamed protein product, partial [Staurois parvus]